MFPLALFSVPVSGVLLLSMTLSVVVAAHLTPISKIAYTTDMTDEQQVRDLSTIIESLENLGVLDTSHTVCYSLDQIVKVVKRHRDSDWRIHIELHVRELGPGTERGDPDAGSGNSDPQTNNASDPRPTSACVRLVPRAALDADVSSTPTADQLATVTTSVLYDATNNDTELVTSEHQLTGGEEEGRLSLAQIMVISSCSSVIGLFFLAAMTMRIRNCLKRKRLKKANKKKALHTTSYLDRRLSQRLESDAGSDPPTSGFVLPYPRPKLPRSHGYKLRSSPIGPSLFYPPDGGGWGHGFGY